MFFLSINKDQLGRYKVKWNNIEIFWLLWDNFLITYLFWTVDPIYISLKLSYNNNKNLLFTNDLRWN